MNDRKNIKKSIGFKFLCIVATFVGVFSCVVLYLSWYSSNVQMEELLKDKAELALQFNLAIRSYVSETIRPFAQEHTDEGIFIPDVMSTSFVARSVFEKVRKEYPDYTIKFSSDNPRNPCNQAEPEELKIIECFNNNPEMKKWSGKIKLNGREHIGVFSARRMKKSCLQCHSDPKDAPDSLIDRYGDKAGFHRPIGEVIALDSVAMPQEEYQAAAVMQAIRNSIVMITGLALLLAVVYYTFQRLIGRKLKMIAEHFKNATGQDDKTIFKHLQFDHKNNDEISTMVKSFNIMVDNLSKNTTSIDNLNREISERKQAMEALAESEKKYRLLADNTLDCIWQLDSELRFTYVNPAVFPMLGFTPEEWTGTLLANHCSSKEMSKVGAIMAEELQKKETYGTTFEMWLDHKNGTNICCEIIGNVIVDENGNLLRFQGTTRDVSERKKTEDKLNKTLAEIERFNKLMIGREGRVIEIKKEVNALLAELDREPQYKSVLEDTKAVISSDISEKEV